MREYILNIEFGTWQNQLWFINVDDFETKKKWERAIQKINLLKDSYEDAKKFQNRIIEFLEESGFTRVQK